MDVHEKSVKAFRRAMVMLLMGVAGDVDDGKERDSSFFRAESNVAKEDKEKTWERPDVPVLDIAEEGAVLSNNW